MNVGYVGTGHLAAAVASRIAAGHTVHYASPRPHEPMTVKGADRAVDLRALARQCTVVMVSLPTQSDVHDALFGSDGLASVLARGTIVIDQTPGDPDHTRENERRLADMGIVLLDAPVHCELAEAIPDTTVVTCGGVAETANAMRPVLEAICPAVVYCGGSGNGHAVNLVLTSIAACNRLITYEAAAVGVKNGVAIEHMATVLNASSGYSSASARVLPVLSHVGRTADVSVNALARQLKLATTVGAHVGAPMLTANLARSIYESAAANLGADAPLDELARVCGASSGIDFADASTWGDSDA